LNSAEKVEELQNYTEDQILLNQSQVNSFLVQTVPDKYDNLVDSTVGGVVSGFQGLLNHLDEKNKQIQEKKKNLGVGE
jgi:DNA polymerase III delta subunit